MNEQLDLMTSLSMEELEAVKEILNEISTTGSSEMYDAINLADYEEIPVDLWTFLSRDDLLGKYTNGGKDIYQTWVNELKYVHNPANFVDQWAITGSTGTGKSTVATYSLCYELYKLMCLKNPNRFYLGANETIWFLFFNLNLKLAEKTMWGKFQKALQMSPWFLERGTVSGKTNLVYQPNKDIKLDIGSTEEHALSVAVQFAAMDEMSFGSNDNVEYLQTGMMAIYNQLYLRLSSRFLSAGRIQGRMYLISSAKSTNAVLESFIKDNEGQPGMHVSRYKQWEVLPASKFSGKWFKLAVGNELLESYIMGVDVSDEDVKNAEMQGYQVIDVPLEMMRRFEMDLNRTLIDTCGIAVQSSYKFIPYRIIEPCLGDGINPFKQEIIKTGMKDNMQIKDFFEPEIVPEILYSKKLYIHCDLSKSGDMTGISCVAVLGYKNQERYDAEGNLSTLKEMVFRHVFSIGLQCPANDELSMIKVKDFIHYLKYDLGWNIAGVSCDGYQSLMLLQSLRLDGFTTSEVSMDILKNKECVGYTSFRNALLEKRIYLLKLHELIREITNLEKNETTGKIDHPRQCLTGDTKVRMLDGTSKTMIDLLLDYQNNIPNYVYSFNETTHEIEPNLIKKVWQTRYEKCIYEITLDNDEIIRCTKNHPFMLRNGQYIEAKNLKSGDALMPLYTKLAGKGGLKDYRIYYEPMEGVWHFEHTRFDPIRKLKRINGNVTHHANYNKLDNRPINLKYITKAKHRLIHNRHPGKYENLKRSKTVTEWHAQNKNSVEYKARNEKCRIGVINYYVNNPVAMNKKVSSFKNTVSKLSTEELSEKFGKNKGRHWYTNGVDNMLLYSTDLVPDGYFKGKTQDGKWYTNGIKTILVKAADDIPDGFYAGRTLEYKNHKVKSIKVNHGYEKVYDLEVENNPNFALDAGIFVHNSTSINKETGEKVKSVGKDISDSLGGAVYNAILSVNLDELDYLDQKILTNDGQGNTYIRSLSTENAINKKFGFTVDRMGVVHLQDTEKKETDKQEDINAIISDEMEKLKEHKPTVETVDPNKYWGNKSGMIII